MPVYPRLIGSRRLLGLDKLVSTTDASYSSPGDLVMLKALNPRGDREMALRAEVDEKRGRYKGGAGC